MIRGPKPVFPKAGKPPTGIFSTRGSQKHDGIEVTPVQKYAHGTGTRSKPSGNSQQGLRHQKPRTLAQMGGA